MMGHNNFISKTVIDKCQSFLNMLAQHGIKTTRFCFFLSIVTVVSNVFVSLSNALFALFFHADKSLFLLGVLFFALLLHSRFFVLVFVDMKNMTFFKKYSSGNTPPFEIFSQSRYFKQLVISSFIEMCLSFYLLCVLPLKIALLAIGLLLILEVLSYIMIAFTYCRHNPPKKRTVKEKVSSFVMA